MTTKSLDYRHRPGKNIERFLIVDMARRIMGTTKAEFQYVGFGAIEFLDFQLMHRALGIDRMTSIERADVIRPAFNKPFKTIRIVHGESTEVFRRREVDLDVPTIMWLDYTSVLNGDVIADLVEVARSIAAPSFVVVSINARPEGEATRLDAFRSNVGPPNVRPNMTVDDLGGRGLAREQHLIFGQIFSEALKSRKEDFQWFQTINVHYRDGALMQTIGGFVLPADTAITEVAAMTRGLDFYRPDAEHLDLRVPVITPRERAALDRQLPKRATTPLRHSAIPASEVAAYRNVYRYLHLAGLQSATETTWTE
jgi:hypothetical protein